MVCLEYVVIVVVILLLLFYCFIVIFILIGIIIILRVNEGSSLPRPLPMWQSAGSLAAVCHHD